MPFLVFREGRLSRLCPRWRRNDASRDNRCKGTALDSEVIGIRAGEIVYDGPASEVTQEVLDMVYNGNAIPQTTDAGSGERKEMVKHDASREGDDSKNTPL